MSALRPVADGLELRVRLTPRAAADRIDGFSVAADGRQHVMARVRAVPEKGAANEALTRLVAEWLGVASRRAVVSAGATSRMKTVKVEGDADALAARARELQGETAPMSLPLPSRSPRRS